MLFVLSNRYELEHVVRPKRGDRVLAATLKLPQYRAVFALHLHATCLGTTIIPGMCKATDFKLVHIFTGSIGTKGHEKKSGKMTLDIVRESRKFSGHPYMGRIARSSLR